ncbi:MAG TPA: PAS domain S-box protein [Bacteroidales bacterium]|nr:PAS domain S-box protein [Bacteroidales bacterium]HOR08753.1 PAS domain S-box protein [Bacteroidales bacterium]HPO39480.1 PAS domain S-box protein [Bacteroidales bacterium]HQG20940.1 PAS domain S-box protein [Bacteroidales bacterium]HQI11257.1 PAS domain S-box protein [Bacteroidales bacterium]
MEKRKEPVNEPEHSEEYLTSLRNLAEIPELAFNSTNQLITLSNLETQKYIEVNQAFLDTTGYRREEIIGKTSDDIQLYVDLIQSRKYMRLISRLKQVSDLEIKLRMRSGDERTFLFSARTIFMGDEIFLITYYNDISVLNDGFARAESEKILREIFDSMSSYAIILRREGDDKHFIIDFNYRAEDVEQIDRKDVLGKEIGETPFARNETFLSLLENLESSHRPYKTPVSPDGSDDSGFYIGLLLSSGDILVTWEAGKAQKERESEILKQGIVFETFAELLPEMIMEIDVEGHVTFMNTRGMMTLGFDNNDLANGITLSSLFMPEDLERLMSELSGLTSPGQITFDEYVLVNKLKRRVTVLFHAGPIIIRNRVTGYRCVLTDVSKRKEYEQKLSNEKALLEHLIDAAPEAIVLTDFDGRILRINHGFTRLFGYDADEAKNRLIDDLVVPEELRDEAIKIDETALDTGTGYLETIRRDKQGNRINVSLIASSVISNDMTIAFLGIYRDISKEIKSRLMQEIQYNISTLALQDSDIFDIYPTIVKEIGKLWNVNNFFIALYNREKDTLTFPFFADERDHFQETAAKNTLTGWVINNNKAVLLDENDILMIEKTGAISLVGSPCKIWMGVPLRMDDEVIGAICLQDYKKIDAFNNEDLQVFEFIANQIALTLQRRKMLDNLITARKRAEEAAFSKQQFMSTMSHEIRTPLNEVIGITNLLWQSDPREDQMDYINTLRFSANHLLTLVNDILDYNKMEAGKIVFEKTEFDLTSMLEDMKRSYSHRALEKGIYFALEKSPDLPVTLIGDPIRLNQILSNLLSNAMKFTSHGGVTLKASLKERQEGRAVIEFSVADTGIGIPREKQDEIFESYAQASSDTTRKYGGTGLGLAICKRLVDLQGGTIGVTSEPDNGSVFTFSIEYSMPAEEPRTAESGTASDSMNALVGKKILVAEDNKINFFVANKFLESWGVKVTHVENGALALEEIKKQDFDLILMDLHMPVMDGIEATRIIRSSADKKISQIPIVALTAAVMSEAHDKIEDLAINDYVLKPFKPKDLYNRIVKNAR